MKKSLIALAVLAASGASFAQSSVTLYGVADLWLGSSKLSGSFDGDSASLRTTALNSGGVATSRFGFKGSEDLGGGLKANFQLEQGINLDTGAQQAPGSAFSRQSWVGLSGGFGEVQLGKVWTSYDDARSSANDTFNANIASSFSTWLAYEDRTNNSIKYITPNFGGFSGSFTYSLGEDKTADNSASDIMSLGAQYAAGPLMVNFAHQSQKQKGANAKFSAVPGFIAGLVFDGQTIGADILAEVSPNVDGKTTYNLINGSYDLGMVKLVAGYNQVKQSLDEVDGSAKAKEYNLGFEAPLAANLKVGAGYSQSKVEVDGFDAFKTTGYSAAVLYSLSKRTTLYGALTQTKLKSDDSTFSVKSQLYAVGVNHSF
ncbi:porin [Rhodoferax antarcticus]|uniref:porin n=1 Tax=Rhodoferax antarcticus TaxID=81479 RepID=UPI0022253114|nr:porin [Rhodoferax antarcticus]MCW2311882.1 putative porin [Rhodoferax antarcticus]